MSYGAIAASRVKQTVLRRPLALAVPPTFPVVVEVAIGTPTVWGTVPCYATVEIHLRLSRRPASSLGPILVLVLAFLLVPRTWWAAAVAVLPCRLDSVGDTAPASEGPTLRVEMEVAKVMMIALSSTPSMSVAMVVGSLGGFMIVTLRPSSPIPRVNRVTTLADLRRESLPTELRVAVLMDAADRTPMQTDWTRPRGAAACGTTSTTRRRLPLRTMLAPEGGQGAASPRRADGVPMQNSPLLPLARKTSTETAGLADPDLRRGIALALTSASKDECCACIPVALRPVAARRGRTRAAPSTTLLLILPMGFLPAATRRSEVGYRLLTTLIMHMRMRELPFLAVGRGAAPTALVGTRLQQTIHR